MKRLKSIEDKNKKILNASSAAKKSSTAARKKSDFNYDSKYAFENFNWGFKWIKRIVSLDSKHG